MPNYFSRLFDSISPPAQAVTRADQSTRLNTEYGVLTQQMIEESAQRAMESIGDIEFSYSNINISETLQRHLDSFNPNPTYPLVPHQEPEQISIEVAAIQAAETIRLDIIDKFLTHPINVPTFTALKARVEELLAILLNNNVPEHSITLLDEPSELYLLIVDKNQSTLELAQWLLKVGRGDYNERRE